MCPCSLSPFLASLENKSLETSASLQVFFLWKKVKKTMSVRPRVKYLSAQTQATSLVRPPPYVVAHSIATVLDSGICPHVWVSMNDATRHVCLRRPIAKHAGLRADATRNDTRTNGVEILYKFHDGAAKLPENNYNNKQIRPHVDPDATGVTLRCTLPNSAATLMSLSRSRKSQKNHAAATLGARGGGRSTSSAKMATRGSIRGKHSPTCTYKRILESRS